MEASGLLVTPLMAAVRPPFSCPLLDAAAFPYSGGISPEFQLSPPCLSVALLLTSLQTDASWLVLELAWGGGLGFTHAGANSELFCR